MNNQISFFVENYGTGVRFTSTKNEKTTIAYIVIEKGMVVLKQNERFPALTIAEMSSITTRMRKVAKDNNL